MHRVPIALLLAAALAAHGACFAQAHARADDATGAADDAAAAIAADMPEAAPRSPFGKVMAVMIAALKHRTREQAMPMAPVRTTVAGTPLGIEIGDAFLDQGNAAATNAGSQATDDGGAAAAEVPPAQPPEDPALHQATLAGPV